MAIDPDPDLDLDLAALSMTEIIRLQNLLSQELSRRFETSAAICFSDIVGSTAYFARFGDVAGRQLQQLHFDLLARVLAAHEGRLVDTAGDGAACIFPAVGAAAAAMCALAQAVSAENAHRARDHQLVLRIGVHWGRVLTDGVQVTGEVMNVCARIAASAEPGQIRLSRECFRELDLDARSSCWRWAGSKASATRWRCACARRASASRCPSRTSSPSAAWT
jgi:class 3 adenylate cyclase